MDVLDASILRELLRDRKVLWGGWDPRLGTSGVADKLGVDRTTVWSRLKNWREEGFLLRQEVLPNPGLFGSGVAGGDIRVSDPREKAKVVERLKLVDGILSGLDQVGPYVILLYAMENERALDRCRRLLGELPDIEEVSVCIPFEPPASTIEPSATDWRIIAALHRSPEAPLQEIAETAGVSPRTLRRRYAELLDANAIWSFPLFDFSQYKGATFARLVVMLKETDSLPGFVNHVREEVPGQVWIDPLDLVIPGEDHRVAGADVYVHLDAPAQAEALQRELLDVPKVADVEVFFPTNSWVVGAWFEERIQGRLKG